MNVVRSDLSAAPLEGAEVEFNVEELSIDRAENECGIHCKGGSSGIVSFIISLGKVGFIGRFRLLSSFFFMIMTDLRCGRVTVHCS